MDISKLPKLSKTDPPPANEAEAPLPQSDAPPLAQRTRLDPLPGLAEVWISIALGAILLFCFPRTIQYFHSPASIDQLNPFIDPDSGNPVPYKTLPVFWADLGVTVFALALLIEGLALLVSKKIGLVWLTFFLTVAATLFNLFVVIYTYPKIGFQLICAIAVAVGGYMAMTQWRLIEIIKARAAIAEKNYPARP